LHNSGSAVPIVTSAYCDGVAPTSWVKTRSKLRTLMETRAARPSTARRLFTALCELSFGTCSRRQLSTIERIAGARLLLHDSPRACRSPDQVPPQPYSRCVGRPAFVDSTDLGIGERILATTTRSRALGHYFPLADNPTAVRSIQRSHLGPGSYLTLGPAQIRLCTNDVLAEAICGSVGWQQCTRGPSHQNRGISHSTLVSSLGTRRFELRW
jgi:hypothetical protein